MSFVLSFKLMRKSMQKQHIRYEEYLDLFQQHGSTDENYLFTHYPRFCQTQSLFYENWDLAQGQRLLDIGAHWLHQAVLYAQDGFKVTAADFPITFHYDSVKSLSKAYDIALFPYHDLSNLYEFKQFADNSFDVILFTEIIEHITFNPIAMWKGLYRILAPQGKIIVTTPNYYFYKSRAWDLKRLLTRMGGGLPVHEILNVNTYGHHWKEFSAREIKTYFTLLSPDFLVSRLQYVNFPLRANISPRPSSKLQELFAIFLKHNIFVEITLTAKNKGIAINPSWWGHEEETQPAIQPHSTDLAIQFIFTPPDKLYWQFAPYSDHQGQYWIWSSIDASGQPNEGTPIQLLAQGGHTFPQPVSAPFHLRIQFISSEGWEISSPTLVLDPAHINEEGNVILTWPAT